MKWFLDLTTRRKLVVDLGSMFILLAGVIVEAYLGITSIEAAQNRLYHQEFSNAVDLVNLHSDQNGIRTALLGMMVAASRADQEQWHEEIKQRGKEIGDNMRKLLARNRDDPVVYARLEEFKAISEAFARTREDELIPLILAGKVWG